MCVKWCLPRVEEGGKRVRGNLVITPLKRFFVDLLTKFEYYNQQILISSLLPSPSRSILSPLRYEFGLCQNTKVVAPCVQYLPVKFQLKRSYRLSIMNFDSNRTSTREICSLSSTLDSVLTTLTFELIFGQNTEVVDL